MSGRPKPPPSSAPSDVAALAADAPVQTTQLLPIGDTHVPFLVTKFPIHTDEGVHLGGLGLDISHERALAAVAARHAHQRALIADTLAHLPAQATSEATAQMICRQVASLAGVVSASILRFAGADRAWPMGLALAGGGSPRLRPLSISAADTSMREPRRAPGSRPGPSVRRTPTTRCSPSSACAPTPTRRSTTRAFRSACSRQGSSRNRPRSGWPSTFPRSSSSPASQAS